MLIKDLPVCPDHELVEWRVGTPFMIQQACPEHLDPFSLRQAQGERYISDRGEP